MEKVTPRQQRVNKRSRLRQIQFDSTRDQTSKMSSGDKAGKEGSPDVDKEEDAGQAAKQSGMTLEKLAAIVEHQAQLMARMRSHLDDRDREIEELRRASKDNGGGSQPIVVKVPTTEVTTPMPYDGTTDFTAYLRQFMVVAEANQWDDRKKRSHMTSNLSGVAVTEVDLSEERNWDELCAALKKGFSPSDKESFASQLRSRRQEKGEALDSLVRDLRRLVKKAHPESTTDERDRMGKSHFIEALRDASVRQKIRDFMPKTLEEAEAMAKRFQSNQKTEHRLSHTGGSSSSDEEEKTSTTKPANAKARAHAVAPAEVDYMAKMEENFKKLEARLDKKWKGPKQGQQGKGRGRGKKTIICFHCHQPDHFARDCPYADQTPMFRPLTQGNQKGQTQKPGAPEVLPHTPSQ